MAEIIWPVGLPDHVQPDGYDEAFADSSLEFAVAQGPPKSRRRGASAVKPLRLTLLCTQAQVALLETFYAQTTASGTLPFTWKQPRADAAGLRAACRMQFVSGQPPRPQPEGGLYWRVAIAVRILP